MSVETSTKPTDQQLSMQEVLQRLANLQYIDSRIDELKRLRGDLPEEILDIETELSRLEAYINRNKAEQEELKKEEVNLGMEIQDSEALVQKYEDQQLTVRNNREYDALTKEIESQKQSIENAKSRLEEIAMLKEELAGKLTNNQQKHEETEKLLDEKRKELDKLEESTESEEKALLEKRKAASRELPQRYLRSYERLRKGLNNGLAVVAMEKGSSMGMMLPPQVQVEVRRMNKIVIDENSGRIVVDPSFFEQAKKEMS